MGKKERIATMIEALGGNRENVEHLVDENVHPPVHSPVGQD